MVIYSDFIQAVINRWNDKLPTSADYRLINSKQLQSDYTVWMSNMLYTLTPVHIEEIKMSICKDTIEVSRVIKHVRNNLSSVTDSSKNQRKIFLHVLPEKRFISVWRSQNGYIWQNLKTNSTVVKSKGKFHIKCQLCLECFAVWIYSKGKNPRKHLTRSELFALIVLLVLMYIWQTGITDARRASSITSNRLYSFA